MKLRLWELVVGVVGLLVGGLYLLAGALFPGVLAVAVSAFFVLARAQIIESHEPGRYALRRGRIETTQAILAGLVALAAIATSLAGSWAGWQHDVRGQIAIFALVGLEIFASLEFARRSASAADHLVGGRAEAQVGDELALLPEGWFVLSNLAKDWGGNVDHVVCGPGGAFVIETKSGAYSGKAGGQAEANARFVRYKLRRNWVVPVVCVGGEQLPAKKGNVWVMSRPHLCEWLLARRDEPAGAEAAAAALRR